MSGKHFLIKLAVQKKKHLGQEVQKIRYLETIVGGPSLCVSMALNLRADDPIAFSERYSFGYFIRAVFHISIPHILVQYTPYFCACFSDIFGKWDLYSPCISLTICSDIWIGSGVVGSVRINFAPG